MIIILAGCDCSGKSTFASMIDKSIWELKKGSANSDPIVAITELEIELENDKKVVHDRIPLIDDIVYSHVFSKKDSVLVDHSDHIHELLEKCCVIYFMCDNETIINRLRSRGDEYIDANQIPEIKSEYRKAFELLNINPHIVDTTNSDRTKVFNEVMEIIKNEESKNC